MEALRELEQEELFAVSGGLSVSITTLGPTTFEYTCPGGEISTNFGYTNDTSLGFTPTASDFSCLNLGTVGAFDSFTINAGIFSQGNEFFDGDS
jgi:hypothetical protein